MVGKLDTAEYFIIIVIINIMKYLGIYFRRFIIINLFVFGIVFTKTSRSMSKSRNKNLTFS